MILQNLTYYFDNSNKSEIENSFETLTSKFNQLIFLKLEIVRRLLHSRALSFPRLKQPFPHYSNYVLSVEHGRRWKRWG